MSEAVPPLSPVPSQGLPAQDPLANLRDIHLPGALDAFPPAPGWWILALLAGLLLAWGLRKAYRHWRLHAYRRAALRQLEQLRSAHCDDEDNSAYLAALAVLLKRTALSAYPRATVAGLSGERWVAFLDDTLDTNEFSMGAGQVLILGPYQESVRMDPAFPALVERWIRRHAPPTSPASQARKPLFGWLSRRGPAHV